MNKLNEKIGKNGLWKGMNDQFSLKQKNTCDIDIDPDVLNDFYVNVASSNTTTGENMTKNPQNL